MRSSSFPSQTMRFSALAVCCLLALSACGEKKRQGIPEGHMPTVGVMTVQAQDLTVNTELSGRLEAFRAAEVRAQVSGIIKRRLFEEGSYVREGQPLYQLESASYDASLAGARAQLSAAQAALAKANADLSRYRPLVEADAISKLEFDAAVAAQRSAAANVEAARAAVRASQVNVNHARISAPISGYISRSQVSEGNLLTPGSTVLARIQQTHPMYVNVSQSAADVMKMRREIASGSLSAVEGAVEVDIILEDGSVHPQKGRLLFADPTVDASTGQVSLRVEVPNEDNVLLPGLYVRVNLPQAQVRRAYRIPQQAVTRGDADTVMVVDASGSLKPKTVTIAGQQGSNWIISAGLNDGDKVVLNGTMIAGMLGAQKVQTQEVSPDGTPAASAPAAPAKSASAPASSASAVAASTASEAQ